MKHLAFVLILLLSATFCRAAGKPNLFAQGDINGGLWLTQVRNDPTVEGSPLVSFIRFRGPQDKEWTEAGRIDGRVIGTAVVASQLAVLQEGGQWLLVWPGGAVTGSPLPSGHPIRAIGSDGDTLWAVAVVTGDLKTTTSPATRRTTTRRSTTRRGTTAPAATQAVEVEPPSPPPSFEPAGTIDSRVILFKLERDNWTPIARIDAPLNAEFAITGNRGQAIVAARSSTGTLRLFDQARNVDDITVGDAVRFALLWHEGTTLLWTAGEKGPGQIHRRVKGESPEPLKINGGLPEVGADAAVAIATGRLRMLYLAPDAKSDKPELLRVWEQKYDLATFTAVDKPVQQSFLMPTVDSSVQMVLRAIMMAGMVIAMVISYQHRQAVRELLEKGGYPEPASLARRAAAGAVDLMAMIIAGYLGHLIFKEHPNPRVSTEVAMAAAWVGYLVYTTVTELVLGRTIGKIVFGLKIVGLDGSPVTRRMILQRNLLRVTDMLPSPMLLLVILSPLRQRVGDIAAGTIVVVDDKLEKDLPTK